MSQNTIKAISNKAGLDQNSSISSRAFELYSKQETSLEVAIALDLEADEVIRLHQDYFKLLAVNKFTRVYLAIKEDPWPFVRLVNLAKDAGMSEAQVVELLKIANEYLPRIKHEYERLKGEIKSLEYEKRNSVRIYHQCD